ncbi:MAG TPA: MerR family transcriptional regulator [Haloplasmataceae bacterium]
MEYTISELARLSGVSTRTLRYYDALGLLKPTRIHSSGYRIYDREAIDRLQLILFYRELGFALKTIKDLMEADDFDVLTALRTHRKELLARRKQLDLLIQTVEKTIQAKERGIAMSDQEKFIGFKERLIAENEAKYGERSTRKVW